MRFHVMVFAACCALLGSRVVAAELPEWEFFQPLDQDHPRRVLLAAKAAECARDDDDACRHFAERSYHGLDIPAESQWLRPIMETACRRGSGHACLAREVAIGEDRKRRLDRDTLQRLCNEGVSLACASDFRFAAGDALSPEQVRRVLDLCERLGGAVCATAGSLYSEVYFGSVPGIVADPRREREFFLRACDTGAYWVCYEAALSLVGEGPAGQAKARRLYEKACNDLHAPACNNLGYQLLDGTGGYQDKRAAKEAFVRACHLGDYSACDFLAVTNEGKVADWRDPTALAGAYASDAEEIAVRQKYCDFGSVESCYQVASLLLKNSGAGSNAHDMDRIVMLLGVACRNAMAAACNGAGHLARAAIAQCDEGIDATACIFSGLFHERGLDLPPINGASVRIDNEKAMDAYTQACAADVQWACSRFRTLSAARK